MSSEGTGGGGRRLGRYHLGESLGGGPTGVVYRAKVFGVAGFERKFAIKRFHDELVRSPSMAAKVAGAARSYGGLEHPNIARLHEFGVSGGETFTATELVEGIDLRQLASILRGGVKPGAAAAALALAARAVGFSHGKGHSHLGLCPTNIVLTEAGQLRVTDFGILPPRLPKRPAQDPTLDARIPFLAPEQLGGEPTSAATDVYQLGVLGYILFIGEPPFTGPSAFEVAQMIMSAQPPEPLLPRPVSKVLRRCLARSPFERYPDGSALADAIEEAAHEAALPGTMADIGSLVGGEMARNRRAKPDPAPPEARTGGASAPLPRKRAVRGPGRLHKDALKKTMMGVAPRTTTPDRASPIRQPTDDVETEIKPSPFGTSEDAATLRREDSITLGPAGNETGDAAAMAVPGEASGLAQLNVPRRVELGESGSVKALAESDEPTIRKPDTSMRIGSTPLRPEDLSSAGDDVRTPLYQGKHPKAAIPDSPAPPSFDRPLASGPGPGPTPATPPSTPAPAPGEVPPLPSLAGIPTGPRPPDSAPPPPEPPPPQMFSNGPPPDELPVLDKRKGGRGLVIAALVAAVLGGGGFALYSLVLAPDSESADAETRPTDSKAGGGGESGDAAKGATPAAAISDADAAVPDASPPDAAPSTLTIESAPPGAKIYLDGTEIGKTPHTMDATADKHRMALILAGHDLHIGDIEGRGKVLIELKEVTPSGGRGGIKVRCKKKNRYYVFVDGKPSGQLCPTERINVPKGDHVVEIYDPVTDSRNEFKANVQKVNRSHRVYVD